MDMSKIPKPGEIYQHFKDKPYQIITVATHTETKEPMVVYQALYGEFRTYVRPLDMFMSEVDHDKYPDIAQTNRFERKVSQQDILSKALEEQGKSSGKAYVNNKDENYKIQEISNGVDESVRHEILADESMGEVNSLLLDFLDADTYSKKLEILVTNKKHLTDRLVNDMSVALDFTLNDGPIDQKFQELIGCLQAMIRFEDRRMR
jgi:hypothetical protein